MCVERKLKNWILGLSLIPILWSCQPKQSLFWEVSGNGLKKSSYLYGTMHVGDERVYQFGAPVKNSFKNADFVALELNMDSVDQTAVMMGLIMEGDYTVKGLLGEDKYSYVDKFFSDSMSTPLSMMNKMQPMYLASMVSARHLQNENDALDLYFHKEAKKNGTTVIGLEQMQEQISAFKSIPYEEQADMLYKAIKNEYEPSDTTASTDVMVEYYVKGDIEALYEYTVANSDFSDSTSQVFNDAFLIKRNHNMVDRVIPKMKEGSVFMAVGAAHLGGETGVIELLRKQGYTVEARKIK